MLNSSTSRRALRTRSEACCNAFFTVCPGSFSRFSRIRLNSTRNYGKIRSPASHLPQLAALYVHTSPVRAAPGCP
jgi:hypothetical protein